MHLGPVSKPKENLQMHKERSEDDGCQKTNQRHVGAEIMKLTAKEVVY